MRKSLPIFFFAFLTAAAGPGRKVAPDLKPAPGAAVDVIVQYTSAAAKAKTHGKAKKDLGAANAVLYSATAETIEELAADPEVVYISPDRPVKARLDLTAEAVNATLAWSYGWTGQGVTIAVIDSGVNEHQDLRGRVLYSESFLGPAAGDRYGHGTHVAGLAAGDGKLSKGRYQGVAPGAGIVSLQALDEDGAGTDSSAIAAIYRAIELKDVYGVRVLNLSLGRPVYESYTSDPLCQAVEAAWKAGIVVVTAAGNDGRDNTFGEQGYGTINSPGNDPLVITVGAMRTMGTAARGDDLVASYSSKGPTLLDHVVKPDLVAPGNGVVSAIQGGAGLLRSHPQNVVDGSYFRLSGTSMAAPVVAGAAALLLEQDPTLTPDQVKARLMKTASRTFPRTSVGVDPATGVAYTSQYDAFTVGAGYLDIAAALASVERTDKSAASPGVVYDAASGTVRLVSDASQVWGSSVVWGDLRAWSDGAVWADAATDGFSVVWGDIEACAASGVWGGSVVWGDFRMTEVEW